MRYFTFAVATLCTTLPLASALPGPPVSAVVVDASDQLFKREVTSCVAGAPDYGHAVELMDCVKWFRDNNSKKRTLPTLPHIDTDHIHVYICAHKLLLARLFFRCTFFHLPVMSNSQTLRRLRVRHLELRW